MAANASFLAAIRSKMDTVSCRPADPVYRYRDCPAHEVQRGRFAAREDLKPPVRIPTLRSGPRSAGGSPPASLLALARRATAVDTDADAANLHLVMDAKPRGRWLFRGGSAAVVDQATCTGCGACVDACPAGAVELLETDDGEWFVSGTGHGPLTHARLVPGRENSGKLVTLLRDESRAAADIDHNDLTIVDGSPGIGCAVVASFTGAHAVLIVTEPTLSGLHDLGRVAGLVRQLGVPAGVCEQG